MLKNGCSILAVAASTLVFTACGGGSASVETRAEPTTAVPTGTIGPLRPSPHAQDRPALPLEDIGAAVECSVAAQWAGFVDIAPAISGFSRTCWVDRVKAAEDVRTALVVYERQQYTPDASLDELYAGGGFLVGANATSFDQLDMPTLADLERATPDDAQRVVTQFGDSQALVLQATPRISQVLWEPVGADPLDHRLATLTSTMTPDESLARALEYSKAADLTAYEPRHCSDEDWCLPKD
jgi:hypothetical protein